MEMGLKLSDLTTLRNWQLKHAANGGELFKTWSRLEWFVRQHRNTLLQQGVLIPQSGSRPTLVTSDFDNAVCEILLESAQR